MTRRDWGCTGGVGRAGSVGRGDWRGGEEDTVGIFGNIEERRYRIGHWRVVYRNVTHGGELRCASRVHCNQINGLKNGLFILFFKHSKRA